MTTTQHLSTRKIVVGAIAVLGAFIAILLTSHQVAARPNGMVKVSGNPATGGATCAACHSGGDAPTVTIIGPTSVMVGETNRYTVRIAGGPAEIGGFNVSTEGGTLSGPGANAQIFEGEATHMGPQPFVDGVLTFSFDWTAPDAAGTLAMYGAGNSANGNGETSGDGIGAASILIDVMAAATDDADTSTGPDLDNCNVPLTGPWPPCAIGGGHGGNSGGSADCTIPASGPWPACATGGDRPNIPGCEIPPSGPWPACATGGATHDDCVIPESGPWPACAR